MYLLCPQKSRTQLPTFKCVLCRVTSFQSIDYMKGKEEEFYSGETWQTLPQLGNQDKYQQQ